MTNAELLDALLAEHVRTGQQRHARIVCADGASVSIQAHADAYCRPQNNHGPYTHVEAGFPTVIPPASWVLYAEDSSDLTGTVYLTLPWSCVDDFVAAHGPIVSGSVPARNYSI